VFPVIFLKSLLHHSFFSNTSFFKCSHRAEILKPLPKLPVKVYRISAVAYNQIESISDRRLGEILGIESELDAREIKAELLRELPASQN